jgi:S1-C subfamily serine protease
MQNIIIKIGREDDNQIILPQDDRLSRYHATLEIAKDGSMILTDCSSNFTMVNGVKISKSSIPVEYGANILFSGIARLDWSLIPNPKDKSKFKWWYIALPLFVLLLGGALYYILFHSEDNQPTETKQLALTKEQIDEKYKKSVGLIVHAYFLKREIKGLKKPLFIGYNKEKYKNENLEIMDYNFNRDSLMPFISTATGFLIDNKDKERNGDVVTNRHVADPSRIINKNRELMPDKELKKQFDDLDDNIFVHLASRGQALTSPDYKVHPVKMKFLPNGLNLHISDDNTTEELLNNIDNKGFDLSVVRKHKNPEIDLALLRTLSDVDASKFYLINPVTEIETHPDSIKVPSDVYLIGFPGGLFLSYIKDKDNINRISLPGNISSDPGQYSVKYSMNGNTFGASGAPVFNSNGKLIAINYRGQPNISGEGVLTEFLDELLRRNETSDGSEN